MTSLGRIGHLTFVLSFVLALAACGGATGPSTTTAASSSSAATGSQPAPQKPAPPSLSAAASAAASTSGAAAAASPAASSCPGAITKVKAAQAQSAVAQGPLYTAVDKGFFAQQCLEVDLQAVNGPLQIPALGAGEIQFAGVGANELVHAGLGGAPVVMLATTSDLPIFWLFAQKQYTTVESLAGQTIGITAAGSSTDAAAHLFLEHFGLLDKVKIAPAGGSGPSVLAAITSGQLAGGIIFPPVTEEAQKAGLVELVNGVKLGVPMNTSGTVVTRTYMASNPDVVKRFLKAYQVGWTYDADGANKASVVQVLAKWTKSDAPTAEVGYQAMLPVWQSTRIPTVSAEAIQNVLKFSADTAARTADPSRFIDNSVLQSVQ